MKIEVLGGAREVGGSCISVQTDDCKVALDYGTKLDEEAPKLPRNFDAVIISHAHLDHSGSLLNLSDNNPVIVGSKITRDVTNELLHDMIKIQNEEGNFQFYDEDAAKISEAWLTRNNIALPGMAIQLHSAGHVAGAKITSIEAENKKIVYTGDFCLHDTEILEGCNPETLPREPDVLISECTYGGKIRLPRNQLINQFYKQVSKTIERKGNILIPTFAFHRTQEMARRIDQAMENGTLPRYNVYTISNLAHRINRYFQENKRLFTQEVQRQEHPFNYRHVKHLNRTRQIREPAIVIATSGFGHAGASLRLLTQWAEDPHNSVILTSGFLPDDSPLKQAKENRTLKDNGETITVQAEIEQIELSGHADQNELIEFINNLKPKKTILVHGELDQAQALQEKISEITEPYIPEKGETINL